MSLFEAVIQGNPDDQVIEAWRAPVGRRLPVDETHEAVGPSLNGILSCYHDLMMARSVQIGEPSQTQEERDIIIGCKLTALEQAVQRMASHDLGLDGLLATRGKPAIYVLEALQMVSCACNSSEAMIC
jgi:hypothetical protein